MKKQQFAWELIQTWEINHIDVTYRSDGQKNQIDAAEVPQIAYIFLMIN